jgi:hypothetical protein
VKKSFSYCTCMDGNLGKMGSISYDYCTLYTRISNNELPSSTFQITIPKSVNLCEICEICDIEALFPRHL